MKVKETIKNKYEECKEKISNMDDFTKGLIFGILLTILRSRLIVKKWSMSVPE